jgi:hypothetical protein
VPLTDNLAGLLDVLFSYGGEMLFAGIVLSLFGLFISFLLLFLLNANNIPVEEEAEPAEPCESTEPGVPNGVGELAEPLRLLNNVSNDLTFENNFEASPLTLEVEADGDGDVDAIVMLLLLFLVDTRLGESETILEEVKPRPAATLRAVVLCLNLRRRLLGTVL